MTSYYAVVEAGGTKFNCAILDASRTLHCEKRIATTTPEETLSQVVEYFQHQRQAGYHFKSLGIACFGPVDLDKSSSTYGCITSTPKPHWSKASVLPHLTQALDCEGFIDTDVNAAALAEYRWGTALDTDVCVYVTVGTGVGAGVVINGKPLQGVLHPELGHTLIPVPQGIKGICPFHGSCVEGLASGKAMGEIWQQPAESLPDDHQAWDIQAQVLGLFCHNLLVAFSPRKIILGGGVMNKPGLLDKVKECCRESLSGYLALPESLQVEDLICSPGLGQHSGLMGGLALCLQGEGL